MARPAQIVYGRAAYEGFAKAIASRMGLKVQLVDGASACIDAAGVIQMPGMSTYQAAHEFNVTCGVIVHELAHQFYRSHTTIDANRGRLEHDCLNAVLDVADETWLSEWFNRGGNGRPGELLTTAGEDAFHRNFNAYKDWSRAQTHAWKVLCVGIFNARLKVRGLSRLKRYTAFKASHLNVDAKACWRVLRRAVRGKKQNPAPTFKRFRKLLRLAKELAELLKPFAADAESMPIPASAIAGALAKGSATPNGREATDVEGAELAEGPVAVTPVGGGRGARGGRGNQSSMTNCEEFDADAFALLAPSVQRIADRIATDGDGLLNVDGLAAGPRLGQAHRLVTDGQCLARWHTSDNADGVAVSVLLDCSGSMGHHLAQCAGVARAFATGMRAAGPVQSLAFGDDVQDCDFATVGDMGGTATDRALRKAVEWLAPRAGQRWIVLVTDGSSNDPVATANVCREAIAAGVRILCVGLGRLIPAPGAACVVAQDAAHLAIELDAAAHLIERGG